jgi:hypothetical protein
MSVLASAPVSVKGISAVSPTRIVAEAVSNAMPNCTYNSNVSTVPSASVR